MPDMHGDCPAMRGFVTCQYDLKRPNQTLICRKRAENEQKRLF